MVCCGVKASIVTNLLPSSEAYVGANASSYLIYSNEGGKKKMEQRRPLAMRRDSRTLFCFSFADPLSFRPLRILSESSTFGGAYIVAASAAKKQCLP